MEGEGGVEVGELGGGEEGGWRCHLWRFGRVGFVCGARGREKSELR